MALNLAAKKSNFISNVVAQAQAIYQANQALIALQSEYANQWAPNQANPIADADFTGTNAYMDATILASFFGGPQAAVASAVSGNLGTLLAVLPQ